MRIGGNDNAKKFFRKHGCTEKSACEKKYTSKAAVAYRAELAKAVDAEGAKRGEGVASVSSSGGSSSLLDNANATMQKSLEDEARSKLNAARSANGVGGEAGVLQPSAKLASQMSGAKGRLATPTGTPVPTPPVSGNLGLKPPTKLNGSGPKLVLRKPTSKTSASSRLLKKTSTSSTASKLRVNKITTSGGGDDGFEDVETTQKNIVNQKLQEENEKKKREEEDAKLARELQEQLNGLGNGNGVAAAAPTSTTIPATNGVASPPKSVVPAAPPKPQISAHEENMKKLSSMNSDFFSGL